MTAKQLENCIRAWHRDRRDVFGPDRTARQRELYDALAAVGGERHLGDLLAVCDDVEPLVVIFDVTRRICTSRQDPTHLRAHGNANRVERLRDLNARRFPPKPRRATA